MFKILIEGKTIKDLKANVDQFIKEFEVLQTSTIEHVTQDNNAELAAKLPEVPINIAEPARSISTTPAGDNIVSNIRASSANSPIASATNDYGVDSRGLPWDERIHAVTQATVKDGSWRYKRGVEESTIKQVEAELVERMKGAQASRMEPSPAVPVAPPIVQPHPVAPLAPTPPMNQLREYLNAVPTPAAVVAPPPLPQPQPVVPSAHTLATFKSTLVPTLAKLVRDGKLTQDYINSLCQHYKVEFLFKANDEQLAEIFEGFVQYGIIVKA